MEAWISHLITFLGGTATGTFGGYFASKYTDKRRVSETQNELQTQFMTVKKLMPGLIAEMESDFRDPMSNTVREFVIINTKGVSFNSSKKRLAYYKDEHDDLLEKIGILEDYGFVQDVSTSRAPIFKVSRQFHAFLIGK